MVHWNSTQQKQIDALEINNRAIVFQKTSALVLISSDMHQSVFAVYTCMR